MLHVKYEKTAKKREPCKLLQRPLWDHPNICQSKEIGSF